ncbi:MAG: hypothetical protein G01um101413_811 [Parcubacteria group bacterium Gr01-1014_13]|nr:MAG: hypothetical protein G01um101413_811 [Parcubacteria group bacterium Gr01-1014_13]
MAEYNLLSDKEAVIWIMEYAKKSKPEALQIMDGFRKSHHGVGVADQMKIHAEVCDPSIKEHCLVSWLPVPLFDSLNKNVAEQKALLAVFKTDCGLPESYRVSFGSAEHIAGMAAAHLNATRVNPFNGLIVNTDTFGMGGRGRNRLQLAMENRNLVCGILHPLEECGFPHVAVFAVGVIKALPLSELVQDGYEIMDNVEPSKFEMKDLEYVSYLERGQSPVWGKTMRQRALDMKANLGLADAKYIIVRSAEIPNEHWNKSILFPGTRLLSSSGAQIIPRIFRLDNGSWHLGSLTITSFWQHDDILVRCKQKTETTKGDTP